MELDGWVLDGVRFPQPNGEKISSIPRHGQLHPKQNHRRPFVHQRTGRKMKKARETKGQEQRVYREIRAPLLVSKLPLPLPLPLLDGLAGGSGEALPSGARVSSPSTAG